MQKLFKEYNGNLKKSCSKDFIGISIHGEVFDMYKYKIKGSVIIDKDFPKMTKWENKEIRDETLFVGKWRNCPLDPATKELYDILTYGNLYKMGYSTPISTHSTLAPSVPPPFHLW